MNYEGETCASAFSGGTYLRTNPDVLEATIGLMTDKRMFRSIIPFWETEGTKLKKLLLMPIEIAMDGNKSLIGLPRRSNNPEIANYLGEMCKPYGTKLTIMEDNLISCEW